MKLTIDTDNLKLGQINRLRHLLHHQYPSEEANEPDAKHMEQQITRHQFDDVMDIFLTLKPLLDQYPPGNLRLGLDKYLSARLNK